MSLREMEVGFNTYMIFMVKDDQNWSRDLQEYTIKPLMSQTWKMSILQFNENISLFYIWFYTLSKDSPRLHKFL